MFPTFRKVPSVGEGAETWSYLTNMLVTELAKDVADDKDGLLASADIRYDTPRVCPVGVLHGHPHR